MGVQAIDSHSPLNSSEGGTDHQSALATEEKHQRGFGSTTPQAPPFHDHLGCDSNHIALIISSHEPSIQAINVHQPCGPATFQSRGDHSRQPRIESIIAIRNQNLMKTIAIRNPELPLNSVFKIPFE